MCVITYMYVCKDWHLYCNKQSLYQLFYTYISTLLLTVTLYFQYVRREEIIIYLHVSAEKQVTLNASY